MKHNGSTVLDKLNVCTQHYTQPSLVVHHHLTEVILTGTIFISQILQLSLVIGILTNFE